MAVKGTISQCPLCGGDMHSGYVWLRSSYPTTLEWSKEDPKVSRWRIKKGDAVLMRSSIWTEKDNTKLAFRCENCSIIVITGAEKLTRWSLLAEK
jgi:hypothetical protein